MITPEPVEIIPRYASIESSTDGLLLESNIKDVSVVGLRNVQMTSTNDSINLNANRYVRLTATTKNVNLSAPVGQINLNSYEEILVNSSNNDVNINSNRTNINISSYLDTNVTSEEGDVNINANDGGMTIVVTNDINMTTGDTNSVYVHNPVKAKKIYQMSSLEGTVNAYSLLVPPGCIMPYAGSSAPGGWLMCNGSSYDIVEYQALYLIIGYTYGGSSSNFYVPDLRGRIPVGTTAGLTLPANNNVTSKSIGSTGGEEQHQLTIDEMPSHNHDVTDPGHTHSYTAPGGSDTYDVELANQSCGTQGSTTSSSTTGISIQNRGGDQPHNNMQPYLTVCYIIKY
jgi:microcystin-dependent protein